MLRYAQLFAKAQFCRVRICVWSDWNGPVPLLMESGIYSDGENVFMTQCGSPFNPQMSVYRVWMNRKQQIKCVVGITIRKSPPIPIFSYALCSIFSHQRGGKSSAASPVALASGVSVLASGVTRLKSQPYAVISCPSRASLRAYVFLSWGFSFPISPWLELAHSTLFTPLPLQSWVHLFCKGCCVFLSPHFLFKILLFYESPSWFPFP